MSQATKIIWAIDPFHETPREQLRALKAIQEIYPKGSVEIQPVSMLRSGQFYVAGKSFLETWHELSSAADKCLGKLLKGIEWPGLLPHRLVKQQGHSISDAVAGCIHVAIESGANLIAVSSHARKGAQRIVLGSFAESLVLQSPLPVLVVNPKTQVARKLKTILFPTDFSPKSRLVYERTVDLAARLKVQVLVFHKTQLLYVPPSMLVPIVPASTFEDARKEIETLGKGWVEHAKKKGVRAKLHLDTKQGRVLDEINRAARKLGPSTLIAIASQSGAITTLVMGSLTRQLLRTAPCPILVIHPEEQTMVRHFVDQLTQFGIAVGTHPLMT